jgi:primosomal protein N' (replication factor Y)
MFQGTSNDEKYFVDVVVPLPLRQAFTYFLPFDFLEFIDIGKRVVVQFGPKKVMTAIVAKIHQNEPETYKAKEVLEILDEQPIVSEKQLKFWKWIAEYYCCSIGEVMAAALPASLKLQSESKIILDTNNDPAFFDLTTREKIVITALQKNEELSIKEVQSLLKLGNVIKIIKSLYQKGLILPKEELTETYKPKTIKVIEINKKLKEKENLQNLFQELEKAPKQVDILLSYLSLEKNSPVVLKSELLKHSQASLASLKSLFDKKIFSEKEIVDDRLSFSKTEKLEYNLNPLQKQAFDKINSSFESHSTVLLHGVTSSGKTYIYFKLIEEQMKQEKQVLYLVPEIALTAQLIKKLRSVFGEEIGIYHSKFSQNERYEIWHKTLNKEYKLVLGVRSALFLPFEDLGLVIVDEEHENTFKQHDPAPRYQARDSAIMLANIYGAKTLLGSATPSFETYFNVKNNKYGYVGIFKRYSEVTPPEYILCNLSEERRMKKNKGNLSSQLYYSIKETIENQDQVMLFQNRRGYAPFLECQNCGWVPQCKNCDISLTYHKYTNNLKCHYCGYKTKAQTTCNDCGSNEVLMKGFGTEKIEDELEDMFPKARIIRMDTDTTRGKKSYQKMIGSFERGEADILVGTQMISKGLDFEKVKIVGILNADQMINYPDFRSVERSFQLMSQVGGRAGRRKDRGKVLVQTKNPSYPVFEYVFNNDFETFYQNHCIERKDFNYPPFVKLIKITLKHKELKLVSEAANVLATSLRRDFGKRILGPEFPPISRLRNQYIQQILLKFERNQDLIQSAKKNIVSLSDKVSFNSKYKNVRIIIDVDPY